MKIIKHGKKMDDVKFVCEFCGCEFTEETFKCFRESVEDDNSFLFSCHCPDCSDWCETTVPKVKLT